MPAGVLPPAPRRAAPARAVESTKTAEPWWRRLFTSKKAREAQEQAARDAETAAQEAEEQERRRTNHILQVIDTDVDEHRITVSSLKGGVTKTTTVLGLGTALARHRRSPVTAIDANPHRGTLAERLGEEHPKTVRHLIDNAANIRTFSEYRRFTNQASSRLEVIACEKNPRDAQVFAADEYDLVMQIITTFRPLVITDTGIDLLLPLMERVYNSTHTLIVPATTAEDGFRLAQETLSWWERTPHGEDLVRNAIVPLTQIETFTLPDPTHPPDAETLTAQIRAFDEAHQQRTREMVESIGPRVAQVVVIPHDPALKRGGLFDWDGLQEDTQEAYLRLAYEVTNRFPTPPG